MDNKINAKVVNSYASGVVEYSDGTIVRLDGRILEPYDHDKDNSEFSKLYKAWNAHFGNIGKNVEKLNKTLSHHLVVEYSQKMNKEVNQFVSNSSIVNNNKSSNNIGDINVTCLGVTSKEVA